MYTLNLQRIKTTNDFILKSMSMHGYSYCYEKTNYINSRTKVTITCHMHGDFQVLPGNHLKKNTTPSGCPNGNCQKLNITEKEFFQSGHILCRSCNQLKPASEEYFPLRENKVTLRRNCRLCLSSAEKERRIKLGEKLRIIDRKRWVNRREKQIERLRDRYRLKKKDISWLDKERKRNRDRAKKYRFSWNAQRAKRRAAQHNATPPWLTKDHINEIKSFYKDSIKLTNLTGIQHHVDHIYPILGKNSCGLHVPWNLQILTQHENLSKSNKIE